MQPSHEHRRIKVTGHVQGVFFRQTTKEKADELQIKGFVRNEPDGSVYLEAEGPSESLEQLVKWCYKGPKMATVSSVDVQPGELKNYKDFEVKR